MALRNQAQIQHDSAALKHAMIDRRLSVAEIARRIRRPRPTVSSAINRGKFPRVLALIRRLLDV